MMKSMWGVVLLAAMAAPLTAQETGVTNRVIGSLDTRFTDAKCDLKGSDFRVSSGKTYLKQAVEASGPAGADNRARQLRDGSRVISDAIANAGQAKSPAAWYYLGRIQLQQGDLVGADSSFTRAEALAPTCKDEIRLYRRRVWAALVNTGTQFKQAQNNDSAMVMYRAGIVIYRDDPRAYLNMGEIFNGLSQNDSAIAYFQRGSDVPAVDSTEIKLRNQSAYDLGVVLVLAKRYPEGVKALRRYLAWAPDDVQAKKALAQAYRAQGQTDSAQVVEAQLIKASESGTGGAELTGSDLMDLGVSQFNDQKFQDAATTFGRVLQNEPYNRNAAYNQAKAYLELSDGPNLTKASQRLIAIEPMSEYGLTLLARGYQLTKDQDGTVKVLTDREALPVSIDMTTFRINADGASLSGTAKGREPKDVSGKPITPTPTTIVVEFLDKSGSPVTSTEVTIPVLAKDATQDISAQGKGSGITAWRYKRK